jgi:hypothetical protein
MDELSVAMVRTTRSVGVQGKVLIRRFQWRVDTLRRQIQKERRALPLAISPLLPLRCSSLPRGGLADDALSLRPVHKRAVDALVPSIRRPELPAETSSFFSFPYVCPEPVLVK